MNEKPVWKAPRINPYHLELSLNQLTADGYHVFTILQHSPSEVTVVAFNQVELAKKLASDQVLGLMQQAGEDALKNALSKEKKE